MSFIRAAGIAGLVLCALWPGRSLARGARSVTLLGVSGPGGEKFARSVEADLGELYEVVSGDVYRSMAARLGRRGASPEEVAAVAGKLRIDAVIGGAVVGEGRNRRLLVAVREGASGRVVARGQYDLSGRTLPLQREKVVSDLVRALEHVRPVGRGAPATVTRERERPEAPEREVEAAALAPDDSEPEPATSEPVAVVRAERPATRTAGVSAGVGPSLLSRYLRFDVPTAPRYAGGTVAGIRVEGAIFPLALSSELAEQHPVLASFGLLASFENVFDFHSSTPNGEPALGHASRWDVRLAGRIPLGHGAQGGTLTVETGWLQLNYGHAAPVEVGVPNVSWGAVDAGLAWDRALGTRKLELALRLAYLGVVESGDISSDAQYGRSTGWGLGAEAALTLRPLGWLWLRLRGSYDRLALSFAGAGTRFAHAASDQWLGGQLEVGFAL